MKDKNSISINPITKKTYTIPEHLDDRSGIDAFIRYNQGKKVVVVQGLGFVGAVMSLICANALTDEYAVIGVDLANEYNFWKIRSINEGIFPVVSADPKIDEFYQRARAKGNLYATYDPYCYSLADIVIVDINLDVAKYTNENNDIEGFDVDLLPFRKAMETIGENCKEDVLILVETTVPPGTCRKVVYPIIKECLEKRGMASSRFKLGHSYERVMPGPGYIDSIQNFYRVYSGIDERSADAVETFLHTIIRTDEYPLTRLGNTTATEMAKVLENSFRAMNIAFIVEWSRFAEEAGVNLYEVVEAIRMRPTHKNIMLPGIGVGGYCLTKDPLMASWAKQNLFHSNEGLGQSEVGVNINDHMPQYAFEFLKKQYKHELRNKKILLLGVSYREDIGDTRYTPVELFYRCLKNAGSEIFLHDPHVRYWEEMHLNVADNLYELLERELDLIIVCTGHTMYRNNKRLIESIINQDDVFVYDTIGIFTEEEINKMRKTHPVKILGRGDL